LSQFTDWSLASLCAFAWATLSLCLCRSLSYSLLKWGAPIGPPPPGPPRRSSASNIGSFKPCPMPTYRSLSISIPISINLENSGCPLASALRSWNRLLGIYPAAWALILACSSSSESSCRLNSYPFSAASFLSFFSCSITISSRYLTPFRNSWSICWATKHWPWMSIGLMIWKIYDIWLFFVFDCSCLICSIDILASFWFWADGIGHTSSSMK